MNKPRYAIVEGEWKIAYSSPNYEQAKRVFESYNKAFPGNSQKRGSQRYYTMYEMTKMEVDNVAQEQEEV